MRLYKTLYFNFIWYREYRIKNRYRESPKGQAEIERVYADRRWGHLQ